MMNLKLARTLLLSLGYFGGVYLFAQGMTLFNGFEDERIIYMALGAALVAYVAIILLNTGSERR